MRSDLKINNITPFFDESKAKIEALEFWNKLNDFKIGFITTAAISAILAAGMWAASWAFGISIPWAVAATITAVTCTAVAEAINIYIVTNDPLIHKIDQNIEIGLSVAGITYAFFRDLYAIIQLSLVTIGTTSVITAVGAAIFAVGVALFVWITHTDIFTQIENSKNEELKKWVEENKNGIVRKYKFEHKEIGPITSGEEAGSVAPIYLFKWTNYASSIEEFKQIFKYVGFTDFLAEAGGQGDTVKTNSLLFPSNRIFDENDFYNNYGKKTFNIIKYEYNSWFVKQKATIDCYMTYKNESLLWRLGYSFASYTAIYHVWISAKFNDFFLTL
ncbi:hypothetical protein [Spiroplasma endosymbiont of Lariophagus distinguendus]|uniref:hypothetical protein n=1 Tax=Spiroplasma endosymbiont of Lariophagus distinguendus TaxID=2935082 RepID=UPI002079BE4D|nr:hypothetical protein [Spiroplasma endosymbiont of Lariophagus distinguendus]